MSKQTVYTLYRFSGVNNLVFADDSNWYDVNKAKKIEVRAKNGRNGIYINRKFKSLKALRKLAYQHRELVKMVIVNEIPF